MKMFKKICAFVLASVMVVQAGSNFDVLASEAQTELPTEIVQDDAVLPMMS